MSAKRGGTLSAHEAQLGCRFDACDMRDASGTTLTSERLETQSSKSFIVFWKMHELSDIELHSEGR